MSIDALGRVGVVLAPVVVVWLVAVFHLGGIRQRAAATLSWVFAFVGLLLGNVVAAEFGWWTFRSDAAHALGQPLDVTAAWALLWGTLPALARTRTSSSTASLMTDVAIAAAWLPAFALVDALVMPKLGFVELGPNWLVGELVLLVAVALPALLLGRWTTDRRNLHGRATLQVVLAGLVLGWLAPAIALSLSGEAFRPAPATSLRGWLGLQLVAIGVIVSVAAVREFVVRGAGTPWPWDPPARIVTGGPYRFVGNPMQVGAVLVLVGEAVWLGSAVLPALGAFAVGFSVTLAKFHEDEVLARRFGSAWVGWSQRRRWWLVRWREDEHPDLVAGTLWVAQGCDPCEGLGRWLTARHPTGLAIWAAQEHPLGPPRRLTYEATDGHRTDGVDALAHALEHLAAPWAVLGFTLRLPGIVQAAQVIGDVAGFGPQELTRSDPADATCARIP